jgi:thioredoxin reductase (NADPH)
MHEDHELVIIGGGPAGLTAGIYGGRARLDTLLIEKGIIGGQIVNAEIVENYPGFPEGISGFDLAEAMHQQAKKHGLHQLDDEVSKISIEGSYKVVQLSSGAICRAKAVIVAGGSERRKLGVPGEDEFIGKGVSYCATCDGAFFTDQTVVVVGGGDSAITEALFLTRFASKITVIHRRDQLRASKTIQDKAFADPKVAFLWDTVVEEIAGDAMMRILKLRNVKTGEQSVFEADGVFIYAGLSPNTDCVKGILSLDDAGNVITNDLMETNVPGILAAGDIRHNSGRQVIIAAGDGATAALSAEKFLHGT